MTIWFLCRPKTIYYLWVLTPLEVVRRVCEVVSGSLPTSGFCWKSLSRRLQSSAAEQSDMLTKIMECDPISPHCPCQAHVRWCPADSRRRSATPPCPIQGGACSVPLVPRSRLVRLIIKGKAYLLRTIYFSLNFFQTRVVQHYHRIQVRADQVGNLCDH